MLAKNQKILVAKSFVKDPVFAGKAIFVAKHDESGAEGFILNGPIVGRVGYGEEVEKLVNQGEIQSADLFMGGPCQSQGIFMIHNYKDFSKEEESYELGGSLIENTITSNVIMPGLFFGSPNTMARIVISGKIKEGKFRFFSGITSWSPSQLEKEIEDGVWEVKQANPNLIFDSEGIKNLFEQTWFTRLLQPCWN